MIRRGPGWMDGLATAASRRGLIRRGGV